MTENQINLGKNRPLPRVDGQKLTDAENACVAYQNGNPRVTREMAQQAAIAVMQGQRVIDARYGTTFSDDPYAKERLQELGVNPDTLEIEEQK